MTQKEVLAHVLNHDCYIYDQRTKDDGIYYYVRKNGTKKMVVIFPVMKGVYKEAAICHIQIKYGSGQHWLPPEHNVHVA